MKKASFIISFLWINSAFGQSGFVERALNKAREKKYEEAIILVDSALVIDSNNSDIYTIKAEFLWMSKNYYQAAISYQKALVLDEDHSFLHGAYLMVGILYEKAGMRTHAQTYYLKAIYFFETKKRKDDKFFEVSNKEDYAVSLKLSGNDQEFERLLDEPFYKSLLQRYIGKNRSEVLEIFFKPFSGD
ncbi:MAG TPA: hypothetical protein VGQ04_02630 [Chitinophagaceae bacterium]|jgi:tetratricopeptide (TPR) repeat protein|nr:hypothetical protein [Chitinophagaceae bacterium]